MNKKTIVFVTIAILLSLSVYAQSMSVRSVSSGNVQNLAFITGPPIEWYKDAASSNPDVKLRICGLSGDKYGAIAYGVNDSGTMKYVIVSYDGSSNPYSRLNNDVGGGCYDSSGASFVVSPSYLTSWTPNTLIAAYPSYLWGVYHTSSSGTPTGFIPISSTSGVLSGYYSSIGWGFDQSTRNINITGFTVNPSGGSSFSATHTTYGVSTTGGRAMAVGICDDDHGADCSDGIIFNSSSQLPLVLYSGISPLLDSQIYYKNITINGMPYQRCIGPRTNVDSVTLSPPGGAQGALVNITASITNLNNPGVVDVGAGKSFNVSFWKTAPTPVQYIGDLTITGLAAGQTKTATWLNYNTAGITSQPTFTANISDSTYNIGSCEGTKSASQAFSWVTYVLPTVLIDGVQTDNFTCAGRPQNVTIYLNDSNNNVLSNTWIYFYEINGISPFAATQVYTAAGGQRYIKSVNRGDIQTDSNGMVQFSLIPTGNKLLSDAAYAYLNLSSTIGSYQLYFTTSNSNQIYQGSAKSQYDLGLTSLTPCSPNSSERYSLTVQNQDTYVKTVLTFVYQTFATARTWLTP